MKPYPTIEDLNLALVKHLAAPGYAETYQDENAFEAEVRARLVKFMSPLSKDTANSCLTFRTQRNGRSDTTWEKFCLENCGPVLLRCAR